MSSAGTPTASSSTGPCRAAPGCLDRARRCALGHARCGGDGQYAARLRHEPGGGAVWDRRTTGGAFTAWDPLDGILATGPEAVAVGTQTYVFALNADGILWYRLWNGASFGAWTSLDGVLGTE